MASGLSGSGTEVDPWLITTTEEMAAVLRDPAGTGFYRIANAIDTGEYYVIPVVLTSVGFTYSPKVIDGDGHSVRFQSATPTTQYVNCCFAPYVHFKNITVHYRSNVMANNCTIYFSLRGGLTDCALFLAISSSYSVGSYIAWTVSGVSELIPKQFRRVTIFNDTSPTVLMNHFLQIVSDVAAVDAYVYAGPATNGVTRMLSRLTLQGLDSASGGAFSDAGWWDDGVALRPAETEQAVLEVITRVGEGVSRRVFVESGNWLQYVGDTDDAGLGEFVVRLRKRKSFTVVAAEDFRCEFISHGLMVFQGEWYLSPEGNGYVYRAEDTGRVGSLSGIGFGGQPITIDNITFSPRPRYAPVTSSRQPAPAGGLPQYVSLDGLSGGGGPVLDGDPAFIDGIVEEIHPMTGARQVLTNCEVVAFERRGSDYVAMGSTYSDGIGGFRLETEIYGGGDVFAFAADFPGVIFQAGAALNVGDRIRPALANGYVYEIVQPGAAGGAEPVWWPDAGEGTEGDIGTARARARPYYQPVGHGPLKMTLIE